MWTVRAATAIVPTTAEAATGVAIPATIAAPAPISTAALVVACSRGRRNPIEPNQRAVPSSVRPCRTPWAIIVPPTVTRRINRASSLPLLTPATLVPPRQKASHPSPARNLRRGALVAEPDPDRAVEVRRVLEDLELRIGHVDPGRHRQRPQRSQPRVGQHLVDRPPVAAEHDGIQCGHGGQKHGRRGVGRGGQRLPGLTLPAAGEPLLRLTAGRAAAVHLARADL